MADIQIKLNTTGNNATQIDLHNEDIKSVESTSQSNSQPNNIYYGSIPNAGFIEINDKNGEIYSKIITGVLPNSSIPTEVLVNGKMVQSHLAVDSNYDINSKRLSIDLENKLSLYDNIMYEGFPYNNQSKNLYELFQEFATKVGFTSSQIEKMLSSMIIYGNKKYGSVAKYFKSISVKHAYIERGTVRETFDKFCTLAQLNLIEDDDGNLIFVQARPIRNGSENVLVIPAKNQMSAIDRNIVVKNSVDKAMVITNNTTTESKVMTNIGTVTGMEKVSNGVEGGTGNKAITITKFPQLVYGSPSSKYAVLLRSYGGDYYEGTFSVPKRKDKTLITNVYDGKNANGELNVKCNFVYTKYIHSCSQNVIINNNDTDSDGFINIGSYNLGQMTSSSVSFQQKQTGDWIFDPNALNNTLTLYLGNDKFGTASYNQSNDTNIATAKFVYNEETGNYDFYYKVLASRRLDRLVAKMSKGSKDLTFWGGGTKEAYGFTSDEIIGIQQEYISDGDLQIDFFGDTITLEIKTVDISENEYGNNILSINGNEMLQTETRLLDGWKTLSEQISQNITSDYANGISTCRVTVSCNDYKDEYGVVRKEWAKGEIFQVGDIVRLDKDNNGTPAMTYKDGTTMLWKVTGRTFRHEGVPLIDLELQEIF